MIIKDEFYTLAELETIFKVTRRTLYNWIKSGELKALKLGNEWRVSKESMENFIDLRFPRLPH